QVWYELRTRVSQRDPTRDRNHHRTHGIAPKHNVHAPLGPGWILARPMSTVKKIPRHFAEAFQCGKTSNGMHFFGLRSRAPGCILSAWILLKVRLSAHHISDRVYAADGQQRIGV